MKRTFNAFALALLALVVAATPALAQQKAAPATAPATIELDKPKLDAGLTVMQAIAKRHSTRAFDAKPLSKQALSDILWAAGGVNRPESQGIVIPTALGAKELDVYAMLPEGVYRYEPAQHRLTLVVPGDHRALAGKQAFAATAPLNLFFVADEARMKAKEAEARAKFGAMTTAFASENVYLYCASAGLSTVVRGAIDVAALSKLLKLTASQKLYLGQSVGHPAAK